MTVLIKNGNKKNISTYSGWKCANTRLAPYKLCLQHGLKYRSRFPPKNFPNILRLSDSWIQREH
ncbi:hypothetical protein T01_7060 [Trichinella spiralis]|uniref:Uncharacterized protein n=1 Tax=Trichinella spiralis TaxID=6334 RepID=A0A0V1ART6_TRISP|nr:hypothetical protein T01_7060 [Trichinella spiralis]